MSIGFRLRRDSASRFDVRGSYGPEGPDYSGVLAAEPDGEVWRLLWEVEVAGVARCFRGVGMETDDALVASRAELAPTSTEDEYPGVVSYDVRRHGRLPARWYHPTLLGRRGVGLSVDGPASGLVGLYRAEYRSDAEEFEPLVKEIRAKGDNLEFDWRSGTLSRYVGCGRVYGASLAAAWARPGVAFDLIRFEGERGAFQDGAEIIAYGAPGAGWEHVRPRPE